MESAFEGHLHCPKSSEINDAYLQMDTSHAATETFQTASEEQHGQWGTEIPVPVVHLGKRLGPDEPLVELRHLLDDPLPGMLPELVAWAIEFCADGHHAEGGRCHT